MLSILMSVYKNDIASFFDVALKSIEQQAPVYDELVVIGDGPLTETLYQVVKEHEKIDGFVFYQMEKNQGLGEALRYGVTKCKGDIIARMDSDDISEPWRLKEELSYLEKHPDVAIVGGWISEFIINPDKTECERRVPETNDEIVLYGRKRCPMNHVTVMFRKEAILEVGNYRNLYYTNEDYDLWIRMINYGLKFHNIQKNMVRVRVGQGMFERRGGKKYCQSELQIQRLALSLGYINRFRYCINCLERVVLQRFLPAQIRQVVYRCLLR